MQNGDPVVEAQSRFTQAADSPPVALVTGGARRIGAAISTALHAAGYTVVIHHRQSSAAADGLVAQCNAQRPGSAFALAADLLDHAVLPRLVREAAAVCGRLDVLINNASSFYPTPVGEIDESQWLDLLGTNLKAPIFLAQAAAPWLRVRGGAIVNLLDVHAQRPLGEHVVYESAKAGLLMATRALARDLAPAVRVNAVAPGNILWNDEHPHDAQLKSRLFERIPLQRMGTAEDIAEAVCWLVSSRSAYITGQVIAVDGGYSLT
jgi:pteridine reductase